MDKLKMQTVNKADENFKKLAAMFPNAVTETIDENGEVVRAIDKDVLMQEINTRVVDGKEERYQFTWPDKKKSVLLANAPISKTLRPCREESVDFDTTENLYIEGDNLEVLKLLQETYLGKIKVIYIDPPYNTGTDFVYNDDFAQSTEEYLANSGQFDDVGNRLVTNTECNGRFHTDWLHMIYPRLRLAKDLLADDGAIFVSIDEHEHENLIHIMNEIFGESNYIDSIVWDKKGSAKGVPPRNMMVNVHEYMLAKTEQQYKKHALKFAEYCKSTYRCKTLEECKSHIQDYANYLTASGKTASTTHTYLASICRVFDIPLSDIKKPIRVVAHNTRSRGRKAVDERKDAGRKVSPRLYDFASIVGIRRNEYLHLASDDLVVDDFGNWCVRVKKGKGGKQQLQRILPEELKAVKAIFDHPADESHLFSKVEMENKIDLHHLRALRAQKMYKYYLERICSEAGYRE